MNRFIDKSIVVRFCLIYKILFVSSFTLFADTSILYLIIGFLYICCLTIPIYLKKEIDLLDPIIFHNLTTLVFIVFREIITFHTGIHFNYYLGFKDTLYLENAFLTKVGVECCSLIALAIGDGLISKNKKLSPTSKLGLSISNNKSVNLTRLIYAGLFFYCFARIYSTVGTYNLFDILGEGINKVKPSPLGGIENIIFSSLLALPLYLTLQHKRLTRINILLIISSLVILFLFNGRRTVIITCILILAPVLLVIDGRIPKKLILVALIIPFVLGLGLQLRKNAWLDTYQRSHSLKLNFKENFKNGLNEIAVRVNSGSAQIPIYAMVGSEIDYEYGDTYRRWFTYFVPRFFWPSKPEGVDHYVCKLIGGGNWGAPIGDVCENYLNFGYLGVIVVYFTFGLIRQQIFQMFISKPLSGTFIFYILILSYFWPGQGSVSAFVNFGFVCFILELFERIGRAG